MLTNKESCHKLLLILLKNVRAGGIETQTKLMVAERWWLLSQLQKQTTLCNFAICCGLFPIYISGINFWLRYLPSFLRSDKSGYGLPKVIRHILVGAHQAKFVSNKIFSLNLVL